MFGSRSSDSKRGRFDEVNQSIFFFAEKYMADNVKNQNELEHSASFIGQLKKRARNLNEEIRQNERSIVKKQKMIKSDIHAYQGLMFEVSATRASLCQRKETKGSIERRMSALLKMLGRADGSSFAQFFAEVKHTCEILDQRKLEHRSVMVKRQEFSTKMVEIEVSNKNAHDNLMKCELSIENMIQEIGTYQTKCEGLGDSVEKCEVSVGDINRIVKEYQKKNGDLTTKKAEFSNKYQSMNEEIGKLVAVQKRHLESIVSEFYKVTKDRFHHGTTKKVNPAYAEQKNKLMTRLDELKKQVERKKRESMFVKEKIEVGLEKKKNLEKSCQTKKATIELTLAQKENKKKENDRYREESTRIDEQIPKLFKSLRNYQMEKKNRMEELIVGNSELEAQLHTIHSQNQRRLDAVKRMGQLRQAVETQAGQQEEKKKLVDEVHDRVLAFRKRLEAYPGLEKQSKVNNVEFFRAGQKEVDRMDALLDERMKKGKEEVNLRDQKALEERLAKVMTELGMETKSYLEKLQRETKAAKTSPPIRQSNTASRAAKLMRPSMSRKQRYDDLNNDLSHLGSDQRFEYDDEEEIGTKRRKLNNGFVEKKKPQEQEVVQKKKNDVGLSDLELEFNLDDVFGASSGGSALSTPVRHSTAISTPRSNGTPHGILDVLNPSTKKKKKKKKRKKKKKSKKDVAPIRFDDDHQKKKSRKRKRSSAPKKKAKKVTKRKKKKKNVDRDLDLDLEDSIDLSVFDF